MGMWELNTDMSKTNPKPRICHGSTLGKPKSDQTGFFFRLLWLLHLRWCGKHKSQLSAKKPGLSQASPMALLWGKQGSWQPLAHTQSPLCPGEPSEAVAEARR